MKKILLTLLTVFVALAANAQKTLDFSDYKAWGVENLTDHEGQVYTQIASGTDLTQGNFKLSISYEDGKNGVRFYQHATSGVVNLRAYIGTTITLSTLDGTKISGLEIDGKNLGSQYVTDFTGYDNGKWSGSENSITFVIKKSTVQMNSIKGIHRRYSS